jgi:N-acetylmuramoyl-L-alanine amidase
MRICLDVQHGGKPNRSHDRGAEYLNYKETYLVLDYAVKTYRYLSEHTSHDVFLITSGSYGERHWWVNRHNMDVYLACHVNSCPNLGGDYSLVEYFVSQKDNEYTRELSNIFAGNFKEFLPVDRSLVKMIDARNRGSYCIRGVNCPAIILEPLFINNPIHLDFALNYSYKIAGSICKSILEYDEYLAGKT